MKVKAVRALPARPNTACGLHQRALVELASPVAVGRRRSPFVLVSHIERRPETPEVSECMAFLAEEDGHVFCWEQLAEAIGLDFAESLDLMIERLEEL